MGKDQEEISGREKGGWTKAHKNLVTKYKGTEMFIGPVVFSRKAKVAHAIQLRNWAPVSQ